MRTVIVKFMDLKGTLMGQDGFTLKLAIMSLTMVAVLTILCQLPGSVSFVLIPLSVLGYWVAAIVILALAVYCVIRKRPRRGASVLLILVLPVLLWRPINWAQILYISGSQQASESVSLAIRQGRMMTTLRFMTGPSDSQGGPNTFLIHDTSDEIALPMDRHTQPPSSENGFGEECAGKVRRLIDHYFVCTF